MKKRRGSTLPMTVICCLSTPKEPKRIFDMQKQTLTFVEKFFLQTKKT